MGRPKVGSPFNNRRHLKILVVTAEFGSMNEAARVLGSSQPAISRRRCGWTWIGLPGGGAGDRSAAPTNRQEDAGLERLKLRREAGQRETPDAALGNELPLPGSNRRGFRANRGRRPRLWPVGRAGCSQNPTARGENG